jgi:hypothetical protein
VQVHAKNGDHHFDGGYVPLAAQMLAELPAHAGSAPVPATLPGSKNPPAAISVSSAAPAVATTVAHGQP